MQASLMQLSPMSRYYVRRMLQQTWEMVAHEHPADRRTTIDADQALETLLSGTQATTTLAELERLAHLHQGLSTQERYREQMLKIETQVASLLGLSIPGQTSEVETANQVSLEPLLEQSNQLGQYAQRFLGSHMVAGYWQATRPQADWLSDIQVLPSGKLQATRQGITLSQDQQEQYQSWVLSFTKRCRMVIRDFDQMLAEAGMSAEQPVAVTA
jgi:hypothetical protein